MSKNKVNKYWLFLSFLPLLIIITDYWIVIKFYLIDEINIWVYTPLTIMYALIIDKLYFNDKLIKGWLESIKANRMEGLLE